jgi:nitrite reductase/ring-hydroxylating ferredoxin subunit/DMSO/TMAO reductase YedYZ heme-binding membrane subunit
MSNAYRMVTWNRNKIIYDLVLILAFGVYLGVFFWLAPRFQSVTLPYDDDTIAIDAYGSCAFFMLSVILCIGPLARLDRRFLPVLYNRRHFGVITCLVALAHANAVLGWYFSFSPVPRLTALLWANTSYRQWLGFPFETFGILALLILVVMAATSHDFWLNFLGPAAWKAIHMSVYAAYALIVLHITFGALQTAANPAFPMLVLASVAAVASLHLLAQRRERLIDGRPKSAASGSAWIAIGPLTALREGAGTVVKLANGERVAIFRYDGKLSATSNVCAHQNGPLGEGRIVDGLITCPWHGFQYDPANGCAPPPFTEKIATYRLKLEGGQVLIDPRPNQPGTSVEPIRTGA